MPNPGIYIFDAVRGSYDPALLKCQTREFTFFTNPTHHSGFVKNHFYDTGLLCSLLGIRTQEQLDRHLQKGALFENFVIVETLKQFHCRGIRPLCYYWRDNTGNEIDLLVEDGARLYPVEIKSGRTLHEDFFKNLRFFHKISGNPLEHGWVIYGGSEQQARSYGNVAGWERMPVFPALTA